MKKRLFIALIFPEPIKQAIAETAGYFKAVSEAGNFVPAENYHLTLKFLGEVDEDMIPDIRAELKNAAADCTRFELKLGRPGYFDSDGRMILWIGLEGELTSLTALWERVENAMLNLSFAKDPRGLTPHVTLARNVLLRIPFDNMAGSLKTEIPVVIADRFALMESARKNGDLIYTPLEIYDLV
jgi:2'-5' RNA ligase